MKEALDHFDKDKESEGLYVKWAFRLVVYLLIELIALSYKVYSVNAFDMQQKEFTSDPMILYMVILSTWLALAVLLLLAYRNHEIQNRLFKYSFIGFLILPLIYLFLIEF